MTATLSPVVTLALRGVAGGALVLAFALLSEALGPKRFAGLFSAAPAVAIASLTIGLATKPVGEAHSSAIGMLAGAAGMAVYVLLVVPALRRAGAVAASAGALIGWVATVAVLMLVIGT